MTLPIFHCYCQINWIAFLHYLHVAIKPVILYKSVLKHVLSELFPLLVTPLTNVGRVECYVFLSCFQGYYHLKLMWSFYFLVSRLLCTFNDLVELGAYIVQGIWRMLANAWVDVHFSLLEKLCHVDFIIISIRHLHVSHSATYLPPKIWHEHCFQFLLGQL